MRIQPPTRYADEFYDLDARALQLPEGSDGVKLAAWWKTASPEDKRDLLHTARDVGLRAAFFSSDDLDDDFKDRVETDDDDEDLLALERFDGDPDEYEEDFA